MSNLPEAIQRQIEEAERLQQELYAQPEGAPVPVGPAALESEPVSHGEVAISEEVAPNLFLKFNHRSRPSPAAKTTWSTGSNVLTRYTV